MVDTCELCAEIRGLPSRFSAIYGHVLKDRTVSATKNFLIIPSLGQIGEAHFLIASRSHETALACLTSHLFKEMLQTIDRVRAWLKTEFGDHIVVFENGDPKGIGKMGCTISHLHVHVVASRKPFSRLESWLKDVHAQTIEITEQVISSADAYSYVDLGPNRQFIIRDRLPSQTIRQHIAVGLGTSNWDWRSAEREDRLPPLVYAAQAGLARIANPRYLIR